MKRANALSSFLVGLLFALGLGISGMTQPAKVMGFLDLFGDWDPSLMFVMIGAIGVHAIAYPLIRRNPKPLYGETFQVPEKRGIDARLLIGASLFGMGWGLGGFCPGPALVSLASFDLRPWLFVVCMGLGMVMFSLWEKSRATR